MWDGKSPFLSKKFVHLYTSTCNRGVAITNASGLHVYRTEGCIQLYAWIRSACTIGILISRDLKALQDDAACSVLARPWQLSGSRTDDTSRIYVLRWVIDSN
jgi:hypothetical protein